MERLLLYPPSMPVESYRPSLFRKGLFIRTFYNLSCYALVGCSTSPTGSPPPSPHQLQNHDTTYTATLTNDFLHSWGNKLDYICGKVYINVAYYS